MKTYRSICKSNDELIKLGSITPMCFLIKKDNTITAIAMIFKNGDEKIAMRNILKKFILKRRTRAYILMQDSIMTMIDKKTGKHETKDVIIRTIFTPKEKYMEIVEYKNKKIIKKKVITSKDSMKFSSEWNIWEDVEFDNYDNEAYQKIKRDNPEDYKEVA